MLFIGTNKIMAWLDQHPNEILSGDKHKIVGNVIKTIEKLPPHGYVGVPTGILRLESEKGNSSEELPWLIGKPDLVWNASVTALSEVYRYYMMSYAALLRMQTTYTASFYDEDTAVVREMISTLAKARADYIIKLCHGKMACNVTWEFPEVKITEEEIQEVITEHVKSVIAKSVP